MGAGAAALILLAVEPLHGFAPNDPSFRPRHKKSLIQLTDLPIRLVPALSPDGTHPTFIRGPAPFMSTGQSTRSFWPDGEPVQLTHEPLRKDGSTVFADGSNRRVYRVRVGPI